MYGPGIPGSGLTGWGGARPVEGVELMEPVELVEPPEWVEAHAATHDCEHCEVGEQCEIREVMAAWHRGESVPRPVVEAVERAGLARRVRENPFLALLAELSGDGME